MYWTRAIERAARENYRPVDPMPRTSQNAERAKTAFGDEMKKKVLCLLKKEPDPLQSEMTFWSRYDAVSQPRGNTDHWTKLKQRAVQHKSLSNPDAIGKPITLDRISCHDSVTIATRMLTIPVLWYQAVVGFNICNDGKHTRLPCGRVQQLSEKLFDDFIVDALQGNMPGTYMYTRPRNSPNRESLRNSFNERAKEGFRYWLIERPKPTGFGKYGIGSYKTVLGVGNAPRT